MPKGSSDKIPLTIESLSSLPSHYTLSSLGADGLVTSLECFYIVIYAFKLTATLADTAASVPYGGKLLGLFFPPEVE